MIVLNGGCYWPESEKIDKHWLRAISKKDNILFIPAATTRSQTTYFDFFENNMSHYGLANVTWIDLECDWYAKALKAKVIYLAGGNTYKLIKILRESGFGDYLKQNKDKLIIIGNSAGAVALGRNILTTNDSNNYGITDYSGLGLVPFSICPHYDKEKENRLIELSDNHDLTVLGIPEQSGIIINGKAVKRIGDIEEFPAAATEVVTGQAPPA